ncbi:MAG: DNA polymerase III subunit gamma/tau [Clostridiales bacterium]|nr:DNA polymerase III subunit gamma/tau [Clostridiales bacterium]
MYTALYRAYRPEVFGEILGQEHIVKILKNQINTDSTSHAYLFCGTRGTGKTTTARILAKGLNCVSEGNRPCGECKACRDIKEGTFLDVIEIDAASNNGVDNIRELRESVKYPPATGRKKVYIIDEVHMLSSGAFNALLKTLEEPPEYVAFILATTEPQKLPATILSRCMRLDFKRVPESVLIEGMQDICKKREISVSQDALRVIAANADGSVRDGLSILDQCISGGDREVDAKDVLEFLGASGEEIFTELTDFTRKGKTADAILLLAEALSDGKDVRQFIRDWLNHYRNLLMVKFVRNPQDVVNLSVENIERIRRQGEALDLGDINRGILELSETMTAAKWSTQPRILLELAIVKLSNATDSIGTAKASKQAPEPEEIRDLSEKKDEGRMAVGAGAGYDLDTLWRAVFEDGEAAKGSFYIIGSGARLTALEESTFTIEAGTEHVKQHAEKNRRLLEELMKKHTGMSRAMRILLNNGEKGNEKRDVKKTAAEAEKILGINIEIQE